MIHTLAKRMASVFISGGAAKPEDEDIYTYACEMVISTCASLLVWILVSVLFDRLLEGIVFILSFASLRVFTGGHHAEHHWGCILASTCILTASLSVIAILPLKIVHIASVSLSLISLVIVFFLAPVEHKNKPISEDKRPSLKKKSRIMAIGFCSVVIAGLFFPASTLLLAVSLSMFSVSMSMAYAVFIKQKRGGIANETSGQT